MLYVLPSEPHIGSKTAGHTQGQAEKDKMWNRLVQQGTSCLTMLKAVVFPQMMEILPRDFSLQYFTCGISAIRPSTCVGVVPSPGTIVASHHSADRQTFESNKVDKVWIGKKTKLLLLTLDNIAHSSTLPHIDIECFEAKSRPIQNQAAQ